MSDTSEKMLTRRAAVEYIRKELGIPISKSTIDKSRMLHGKPQPDGFYGNRELFSEPTLRAYALSIVTTKPTKLIDE
jgi:hypothetical protein